MKTLLTALLLSAATLIANPPAKTTKKPATDTEYAGIVTVVAEPSISVKGDQGTREFQIHPGTIYGTRGKNKLTDFPVGTIVIVTFSKEGSVRKAENIHKPRSNSKVAKGFAEQAAKTTEQAAKATEQAEKATDQQPKTTEQQSKAKPIKL